ncbi:hypothetical protein [Pontixanthobacter sp.]|uniref:hypothetical protein n=1 Tax=Pontixanthobacter sp. TaxID=2792078 RepID=UPI003C7DD777
MRIMFLFNHDAAHQAAHIAGIMAALAGKYAHCQCVAATGSPEIETQVRALISADAQQYIEWADLSLSPLLGIALAAPNALFPAKRLTRLRCNQDIFQSVDAIVSTERTCLRLKRRLVSTMGARAPQFIYVPHGSGDRNVAYHPALSQFDHMLLSGQKLVDEMTARGLSSADRCHLIGYPKFDTLRLDQQAPLFDNDRPTFVYNPHFDPTLSSWYECGPQLLNSFAAMPDRYNLIFAPHVMLFRKKLHISLEYRTARIRPDIPSAALAAPNILVDIDSPALFDMTYTLAADAYIGDMSSQIYEFLLHPRPAFFIDTHSRAFPDEHANRAFWQNGPVVQSVPELLSLLPDLPQIAERYRATQDRLFSYTIDYKSDQPSVDRAAAVLAELM